MIIDSSTIGMESARRYTSSGTKVGRYRVMDYRNGQAGQLQDAFSGLLSAGGGQEQLQETAEEKTTAGDAGTSESTSFASLEEIQQRFGRVNVKSMELRENSGTLDSFRQLSLRYIFSLLFGREKAKSVFEQSMPDMTKSKQYLVYTNQISFYESESTSFCANGTVKTADGREINFNVDVSMSREFSAYYEENYEIAAIQTCDPLVINLSGDIAKLSDQKFFFDIDADGTEDEISMLEAGSGYLALDKNGDGKINDGRELFGPESGNGFADLAAYDEDGNGWIDEADDIWSKLKIWCKDEDGKDKLCTLAESGVGAICLQNAATDFTLGNSHSAGGFIRSTGIFLYENGNVGTIQHLDLAQ
ncbi:MAG: hypothetical protein IJ282_02155 [Lachnospiraceae bacterium]|nr:hypothetical protein [Lachnospiraceae bacterium]